MEGWGKGCSVVLLMRLYPKFHLGQMWPITVYLPGPPGSGAAAGEKFPYNCSPRSGRSGPFFHTHPHKEGILQFRPAVEHGPVPFPQFQVQISGLRLYLDHQHIIAPRGRPEAAPQQPRKIRIPPCPSVPPAPAAAYAQRRRRSGPPTRQSTSSTAATTPTLSYPFHFFSSPLAFTFCRSIIESVP